MLTALTLRTVSKGAAIICCFYSFCIKKKNECKLKITRKWSHVEQTNYISSCYRNSWNFFPGGPAAVRVRKNGCVLKPIYIHSKQNKNQIIHAGKLIKTCRKSSRNTSSPASPCLQILSESHLQPSRCSGSRKNRVSPKQRIFLQRVSSAASLEECLE